ncbi:energy-coupling factor transporter ATPase [Candidatus Mycoplasma mahonii]|uniref:energy-coupling factor transporter ATPase n=1 Tax=Candidatus Mycoplasma mahonii TaxID=3004105 RepID=UPI0026F19051|nr:energy-coupling factor transporter ATPase [Candidatus Mycoplasma mahonii]WKX02308.1 energy-coupling factor transporter ATPase [Candidatus Mycoplasma mahonii]
MQIITNKLSHTFDKGGYSEFQALFDVNCIINKGEFVSIIGQTGSGKTTFIEHLNALLIPTTGEVIIDGRKIINTKRKLKGIKEQRKKVGIVFQFAEYQLFEETIEKDIIFGPISLGMDKDKAKKLAKKYIKIVGLDESYLSVSPFSLSGGQKRRVALAGILSMEPDILILDEPTAGLDPEGEIAMYKIFQRIHKEGKAIVVVTHNLDHALSYSNRTIVFKEGRIVKDGKTIDILYNKDLLKKNELETPKLVSLVHELESKGLVIGKVNNIDKLVKRLG